MPTHDAILARLLAQQQRLRDEAHELKALQTLGVSEHILIERGSKAWADAIILEAQLSSLGERQ